MFYYLLFIIEDIEIKEVVYDGMDSSLIWIGFRFVVKN